LQLTNGRNKLKCLSPGKLFCLL